MLRRFYALLKDVFKKSPLASNVALAAIMLALEKLLELEFYCPCSPMWNVFYTSAFFIIPTVASFTLMLLSQNCKCTRDNNKCNGTCDQKNWGKTITSFCTAIVWLVLVLYDGQYFACACTDWEGSYGPSDYIKWCRPENVTDERRIQLTQRVKYFYLYSQVRA